MANLTVVRIPDLFVKTIPHPLVELPLYSKEELLIGRDPKW